MLKRAGHYLVIYAAIIGVVALVCTPLPSSFHQEDQGNLLVVQLPSGATGALPNAVIEQVEDFMLKQPEVLWSACSASLSGQGRMRGASLTLKTSTSIRMLFIGAGFVWWGVWRAVGYPRRRCLSTPINP
jgi:multidrug efflux pump